MCGVGAVLPWARSYRVLLHTSSCNGVDEGIRSSGTDYLKNEMRNGSHVNSVAPSLHWPANFLDLLRARGPDALSSVDIIDKSSKEVVVNMVASTLHIRGTSTQVQPVRSETTGNVLAFNGEIFGGDVQVSSGDVDTLALLNSLDKIGHSSHVINVLNGIEGPFSFIFWQASTATLWFGRDKLGRRSLLLSSGDQHLTLASIATLQSSETLERDVHCSKSLCAPSVNDWIEVPCTGIFSIQLSQRKSDFCNIYLHLWPHVREAWTEISDSPLKQESSNLLCSRFDALPGRIKERKILFSSATEIVDAFEAVMSESVRKRVQKIDLPSSREAARIGILFSGGIDSTVLAALAHRHLPESEPIELINVAFGENEAHLNDVPDRQTAINALLELRQLAPNRNWQLIEVNGNRQRICAASSRILHLLCPSSMVMDFNIGAVMHLGSQAKGLKSDIDYHSEISSGHCRYAGLNNGQDTDMAAYMKGVTFSQCTASCKVLLHGAGADEQLAGYGRHRTAFRQRGEEGLVEELDKDMKRLWKRNLGRDDRLLSDSGREARFPFLDCRVMSFISSLNAGHFCDLSQASGVGDKKLLRELALRLGLHRTSRLQKRAIQFGTRIANRRCAGYVQLTGNIGVDDIVNESMRESTGKRNSLVCKKIMKRLNKPGFV